MTGLVVLAGLFATMSPVVLARIRPHANTGTACPVPPFSLPSSVTASNGLGELPVYTFFTQQLNDRMHLHVNVVNGNLVLDATDLQIQGTGINLTIERYYNVQADTSSSDLGNGWVLNVGAHLQFNSGGSVTFYGPSDFTALYASNGSGGYADASGLDATLTQSNDTYDLYFDTDSHDR
jgi:hypothetical protein